MNQNSAYFYAPEIKDRWAYWFCPVCHSIILSFCPPLWNFNLANNFWTMTARALIFHMNILCDKTFHWVPLFLTLWPWPWSLTHFFWKILSLLITFKQWVLELKYFKWIFPVINLSVDTTIFDPITLTFEFAHFLKDFNLAYNFEQWVLELWYFTWIFPVIRPSCGYHFFYPVTLTLEFDSFFLKTLTLLITFEQWVPELDILLEYSVW